MGKMVSATEFKAKSLALIDEMQRSGEPLTVTRRGKPSVTLVAERGKEPKRKIDEVFGALKGTVTWTPGVTRPHPSWMTIGKRSGWRAGTSRWLTSSSDPARHQRRPPIMMGEGLIGQAARDLLDNSDELRCSAMVQWEIATLARKGKLRFEMPVDVWLEQAARLLDYREVPVTGGIARDAGSLPSPIRGDPGDRVMIATARAMICPLMTTDEAILDYAAAGYLQAIDPRR